MKKKILLILSLFPFSAMSVDQYPDSVVLNSNMRIDLSHRVDNKFTDTEELLNITYGEWGHWETVGNLGGCGSWTPSASTVNLGVEFTQERWCDAKQMRERDVNYHYADGSVFSTTESDTRIVPDEIDDERTATGTKNYIVSESTSLTSWRPNGDIYAVTDYLPLASTVDKGVSFLQTKKWLQDYQRISYTYNHWANGDKTVKSSYTQVKIEGHTASRMAVGTKENKALHWVRISEDDYTFKVSNVNGKCFRYESPIDGETCSKEGEKKDDYYIITSVYSNCYVKNIVYQCKPK